PKDGEPLACATAERVRGAVAEPRKYSTKPADMVADPKWVLELTRQTHKRRFVATGGALKDVLKLDQETDADMVIG
ncbi:protein rep, partial [Klebsiella pneumoniae]|nr:protein rep [Klebsiella pneumoniae]